MTMEKPTSCGESSGDIRIRGARQNNLKNVNVNIPRDVIVVFTGVSRRALDQQASKRQPSLAGQG